MITPCDADKRFTAYLQEKASWVRRETLKIHQLAPETRIASSLSDVEIFVALYYGKILKYDSVDPRRPDRDRLILSKGHGGVSLYPILADVGYFDRQLLSRVCRPDSFLGAIPDGLIPGIETINGSLGHGLGVACGMALALRYRESSATVFAVVGDGEMNEGSVWEAIMFAGHHGLNNLILIVDNNRIQMLDYCERIVRLTPLDEKLAAFGWHAAAVDGHNLHDLLRELRTMKAQRSAGPRALVANTVKGKGVAVLEDNALCHVRTLREQEITEAIAQLP